MPIFNPSPSSSAEGNKSNPRRRPSWSSLAKPALGVALTMGVLTTGQARAYVVNIGGQDWDVTTFTGSYNDHKSKFAQTSAPGGVMPWWGDSSLATQFSNALGYSLGTPNSVETLSAGSPTNMNVGPYFAYNSIVDKITFLLTDTAATYHPNTSPLIFSVDLNSSVTWAQVAPKGTPPGDPKISTVPGPVPVIGAFAAFGYSRKLRKRIKLSTNTSASLYGS
jgi:hypothetical protein